MEQKLTEKEFVSKCSHVIARRLREAADEIEKSNSILYMSADFDLNGFSCEYQTLRGRVNLEVKTETLI